MARTTGAPRHKRFGDSLQYWRQQRGLTQVALGQALGGKDGSAINQMEKGTYNPTLKSIYRLAVVLGIPVAALFQEPPGEVSVALDGLSPPLQANLTALITHMKDACQRKPSD